MTDVSLDALQLISRATDYNDVRTSGALERSFVFGPQYGGDDVILKTTYRWFSHDVTATILVHRAIEKKSRMGI